ncbi:MAG: hypothetical protein AAF721_10110 [Myxococcota bacterium]
MTLLRVFHGIGLLASVALSSACIVDSSDVGDVPASGGESGSGGAAETSSGGNGQEGSETGPVGTTDAGGSTTDGADEGTTTGLGGSPLCGGALSESWSAWNGASAAAGDSYTFSVTETEVFEDACAGNDLYRACVVQTDFVVEAGVITGRSITVTPSEDIDPSLCPEEYEEVGADVGSNNGGFLPSTLPDMYQRCCDMADQQGGYFGDTDRGWSPGDLVIRFGDDGFLEQCTTLYCDDCGCDDGTHITLSDIEL